MVHISLFLRDLILFLHIHAPSYINYPLTPILNSLIKFPAKDLLDSLSESSHMGKFVKFAVDNQYWSPSHLCAKHIDVHNYVFVKYDYVYGFCKFSATIFYALRKIRSIRFSHIIIIFSKINKFHDFIPFLFVLDYSNFIACHVCLGSWSMWAQAIF
jgi:hypothetical protein